MELTPGIRWTLICRGQDFCVNGIRIGTTDRATTISRSQYRFIVFSSVKESGFVHLVDVRVQGIGQLVESQWDFML